MDDVRNGKRIIILIIALYIFFELVIFVMGPSFVVVIRAMLAGALFYFLYVGRRWARVVLALLYLTALGMSIPSYAELFPTLDAMNLLQLLMMTVFVLYGAYLLLSAVLLLVSRQIRAYVNNVRGGA